VTRLETAAISAAHALGARDVRARQNPISRVLHVDTEPQPTTITSRQGRAIAVALGGQDLFRVATTNWGTWSAIRPDGVYLIVHTRPVVTR
jgi:hypothetical protein